MGFYETEPESGSESGSGLEILHKRLCLESEAWPHSLAPHVFIGGATMPQSTGAFRLLEATIESIHSVYKSGALTYRQLTQMYLDRIDAYDQK